MKVEELNWLYFDLDCYFASIEQQLNASLKGKSVIVVPSIHDSATAIAASYEARKFNIKTGTKVYIAKKLCSEVICVEARPSVYVKYHKLIFDEIDKHLLVDHVFSIDEGACKLTGSFKHEENAVNIARKIQSAIKRNIGQVITCSIGIAPNKFIAKIASNIVKPNGITVIHKDEIRDKLSKLELRDLPGIGSKTEQRLISQGVYKVDDLYKKETPGDLGRIFGSIIGQKYWYLLRGVDFEEEETKKSSISQSKVLIEEERSVQKAREVTMQLILKAASRLRSQNLTAAKVTIQINLQNKDTIKKSEKILRTDDSHTLSKAILTCFDLLTTKLNNHKASINTLIQKVSLTLSDLEEPTRQLSLMDLPNLKKKSKVSKALDDLNKKYGNNAISIGLTNLKKETKDPIAFGHIPKDLVNTK